MYINQVLIEDTFAEAFPMWASRLLITADTQNLANQAAESAAGLATSIIGCGVESGLGEVLAESQSPDGRPGRVLLLFSHSKEKLEEQIFLRVGQAILPSATSACFNGLTSETMVNIGGKLRYFGDGFQSSKLIQKRRFWRIPVADGEFVVEESFGLIQGVGGGNMIILGSPRKAVLEAATAAVEMIRKVEGAIAPFPGGVCRSPSKPGSKYKNVRASTNHFFCPTLRTRCETQLPPGVEAVYEIVIDGMDESCVAKAMKDGLLAACLPGVQKITAGNYGGKLGPFHFHLHQLVQKES